LTVTLSDSLQATKARNDSLQFVAVASAKASGKSTAPRGGPFERVAARGDRRRHEEAGLSSPAPGVVLPVIGEITSVFSRSRFHPLLGILRPHRGVDVSAPAHTPITAPADGRVTYVGRTALDGRVVELDHGGGVVTRYAHCSKIVVKE